MIVGSPRPGGSRRIRFRQLPTAELAGFSLTAADEAGVSHPWWLVCAAAGLLAAAVVATPGLSQLPITTGTTTGATTTAPTTTVATTTRAPQADLIPEGVIVGRVEVGGLTPAGATALVQTEYDEPLTLVFGRRKILVTPQRLGATARVKLAIDQARRAAPATQLPLFVILRRGGVAR